MTSLDIHLIVEIFLKYLLFSINILQIIIVFVSIVTQLLSSAQPFCRRVLPTTAAQPRCPLQVPDAVAPNLLHAVHSSTNCTTQGIKTLLHTFYHPLVSTFHMKVQVSSFLCINEQHHRPVIHSDESKDNLAPSSSMYWRQYQRRKYISTCVFEMVT